MAGADYWKCELCGAKAFYDAAVSWDTAYVGHNEYGEPTSVVALCEACDKTHEIKVVPRLNAVKS